MRRRVKGIKFDPRLLDEIEGAARRAGESPDRWIEEAARQRLGREQSRPPLDPRDVAQRRGDPFRSQP